MQSTAFQRLLDAMDALPMAQMARLRDVLKAVHSRQVDVDVLASTTRPKPPGMDPAKAQACITDSMRLTSRFDRPCARDLSLQVVAPRARRDCRVAELASRHAVQRQQPANPELGLADPTGAALEALGLNNAISAGRDDSVPMAWARAIHGVAPRWNGIRDVSRASTTAGLRPPCSSAVRSPRLARTRLRVGALDRLCDAFGVAAIEGHAAGRRSATCGRGMAAWTCCV